MLLVFCLIHVFLTAGIVEAGGGGHVDKHTDPLLPVVTIVPLECGGHHCHPDQVCIHSLEHHGAGLKSECKPLLEAQRKQKVVLATGAVGDGFVLVDGYTKPQGTWIKHHAVPCTQLPTGHEQCYCTDAVCNTNIYNLIYQQNHVNPLNVPLVCGGHTCAGHEKCHMEETPDGKIHFLCTRHKERHCLPNLLTHGGCVCDTRACVEQTLISIVAGHQVSGLICADHDDKVCQPHDVCTISHENNGHFKKHCVHPNHIVGTECTALPALHHQCYCTTQECIYGEFTAHVTTTIASSSANNSPTSASSSSTIAPMVTAAPSVETSAPSGTTEAVQLSTNASIQQNTEASPQQNTMGPTQTTTPLSVTTTGTGGSTGTGSGNTTIDQFTCMDHDTRCSLFSAQICSPTVSHDYVVSTCAKTCNLCTEYLASLKGTKKVKCMVCGDNDAGIPCSLKDVYDNVTTIMECPQGSDYCMTDMHVDGSRNQDVFKRCVTRDVCEQKWIQESADLDYCNKYGQVSNPNPHECHFCCTGEACNSMVKPSDQTLVPKSN